jgi:DNA-binding MarR family transcriptional regulator
MDLAQPSNCVTLNCLRASRALVRRLDAALAPLGLSAQQFSAIAVLAGHGKASTSKLAELLGADRTTVTRNMTILRKKGLVEQVPHEDQRVNALQLCAAGRKMFDEAMPLWRSAQKAALARLGDVDPDALLATLRKL